MRWFSSQLLLHNAIFTVYFFCSTRNNLPLWLWNQFLSVYNPFTMSCPILPIFLLNNPTKINVFQTKGFLPQIDKYWNSLKGLIRVCCVAWMLNQLGGVKECNYCVLIMTQPSSMDYNVDYEPPCHTEWVLWNSVFSVLFNKGEWGDL